MIEETIVAALEASSAVGTIAGDRIYPDPLPQDATLPAVAYRRVSGQRGATLDGPDGTGTARMQFDCCAATPDAAKALAEALIDVIQALPDTESIVSSQLDSYEPDPDITRAIVDVEILYIV